MGGGSEFWIKIINFCPFRIKKFWEDFGAKRDLPVTNRPISGQYRPHIHNQNFKNTHFGLFQGNLKQLFFFKLNFVLISSENYPKWTFRVSLDS